MVSAQAFAPVILPLFDGLVVNDPYRYLSPPIGADGSPSSAAVTLPVSGNASPAFAVYTSETPPQAELLAHGGELAIGVGSTSMKATIDPIPPPSSSSGGTVAGNVYRLTVTDQAGAALAFVPGQTMTLAMRGPAGIPASAVIARLVDSTWQPLPTNPSGLQDLFLANTDALGTFALLGTVVAPPSGFPLGILAAALALAGLVALLGLRYGGRPRAGSRSPAPAGRQPQRTSRKRNKR
jgi:hypothetical protein